MLVFTLCAVLVLTIIDRISLIYISQAMANKLRREGYVVVLESDIKSVDLYARKPGCPDLFVTGSWWFTFGRRRKSS